MEMKRLTGVFAVLLYCRERRSVALKLDAIGGLCVSVAGNSGELHRWIAQDHVLFEGLTLLSFIFQEFCTPRRPPRSGNTKTRPHLHSSFFVWCSIDSTSPLLAMVCESPMKVVLSECRCVTSPGHVTQFEPELDEELCADRLEFQLIQDTPMKVAVPQGKRVTWQGDVSSFQAAVDQAALSCQVPGGILKKPVSSEASKAVRSNRLHAVEGGLISTPITWRSPPGLSKFNACDENNGEPDVFDSSTALVMAQDPSACSILIKKWACADCCGRQAMISVVLPLVEQLSYHPYGHLLVTALLNSGTPVQCRQIAQELSRSAALLAEDVYGCVVIQQALLRTEASEPLVSPLIAHLVQCSMHLCGNHVMQLLVEVLPPSKLAPAVRAVCQFGVKRLSLNRFGCRIVQRLLQCGTINIVSPILDDLQQCSYDLIAHQYGNYVLQDALLRGRPEDRVKICGDVLRCDVISLRNDRCAHKLVEKCVCVLGHTTVPELQKLWTSLCACVVSSDMWLVPQKSRDCRRKALIACRELMLRCSVGTQHEELRRCLTAHRQPRK